MHKLPKIFEEFEIDIYGCCFLKVDSLPVDEEVGYAFDIYV